MYEEEVLESHDAMWFSPDGAYLAFIKFNDTAVNEYGFPLYEHETPRASYPTQINVKYPKPGYPNPIASIHITSVIDSSNSTDVLFSKADMFAGEFLITEVLWLTKEKLLVRFMNRVQDSLRVFIVSLVNGQWTGVLSQKEDTSDGAWFNYVCSIYYMVIKVETFFCL